MAWGHSFAAVRSGMAECTPNFRAAYDAADTTPRSCRWPPTTTGLPFREGSNNSSTETKKASMSTWKTVLGAGIIKQKFGTGGPHCIAWSELLSFARLFTAEPAAPHGSCLTPSSAARAFGVPAHTPSHTLGR